MLLIAYYITELEVGEIANLAYTSKLIVKSPFSAEAMY